jgi:manganese-dependent ADP-ribose/CDP-alcohol diphosphatase
MEYSEIKCAVIADVQYADQADDNSRCYRQSLAKLEHIIEDIEKRNVDFVLQLGDLIDCGWSNFDPVLTRLQKLSVPVFHVLGNHDFAVDNNQLDQVIPKLELSERYYDFAIGGWRFVVLDGSEVSSFANPEGSEDFNAAESMLSTLQSFGASNAHPWNGAIGIDQIMWLVDVLERSATAGEKVVIACHFPIITSDCYHTLLNSQCLHKLIRRYNNVILYLSGHDHRGYYSRISSTHMLTVQGIVERDDEPWSLFSFTDSGIRVTGFDTEPSRILPLHAD